MKKYLKFTFAATLLVLPIVIGVAIFAGVGSASYAPETAYSYGKPATDRDLSKVPYTVLDKKHGRVVSGKEFSEVVLKAKYADKSLYAHEITIDINDKSGKTMAVIHPKTDSGYTPAIQLLPFNNSGLKQIYLGMGSGGSGGYSYNYVYSAENSKITTLFDYEKFNAKSVYTAQYLNGYKVGVFSADKTFKFIIDISARPKDYLSQIYNADGTLIKPQSADVNAVSSVNPYFNSTEGVYQLAVYQRITGLYNADGLGTLATRLSLKGDVFEPYLITVEIYPNDIKNN